MIARGSVDQISFGTSVPEIINEISPAIVASTN